MLAQSNTNTQCNANSHPYCDSYGDSESYSYTYTKCTSECHTDADAYGSA